MTLCTSLPLTAVKTKCKMRLDDVVLIVVFVVISSTGYTLADSALSYECPGNDVTTIRQKALQFEFSLVLYYVSWCRESIRSKNIYQEVARHYQDEISFSAVDCWHLECNCSRTMPSMFGGAKGYPQKWPTLIVHYGHQLTLRYRDEWSIVALTRFIGNLFRPIERLNSREELKMLNMRSNSVVLGLFQNASGSEYYRFTIAALKWLDGDPDQLVRFAVCFGETANEIVRGLGTTTPFIALLRDRDIEVFHFSETWTSNNLVAWLLSEIKRINRYVTGFSTPLLLMEHIRKGAVLAIFASDWKHSNTNFYTQISAVIDQHQLMGSPPVAIQRNAILKKCQKSYDASWNSHDQRLYEAQLQNELENGIPIEKGRGFCKAKLKINNGYGPLNMLKTNHDYASNYMTKFQPTVQFQAEDHRSAVNLLELYRYSECLKAHHRQNTPEIQILFSKLLMKFIEKAAQESVNRHNRTMSVQIMDANKHRDLLQNLGLDNLEEEIEPETQKTRVLIIEPNQEGVYKMAKPFTHETLLEFIKDYYHDNLYISRRTTVVGGSLSSSSTKLSCLDKRTDSDSTYCIEELSRQAFFHRIEHFWQNTTTVLLIYTPRCAFSSMMSHSLMQVAAMLHGLRQAGHINIVRLNVQTNDLPWEFITQSTPTLVVFPRGHPSESRFFPASLGIDVRNVFAFIIAQLEPIEQLRVVLSTCSPRPSAAQQLTNCLNFARTLAIQHINDHLRLWQIFKDQREAILGRLKQFKDITLDIQERFLL